MRHVPVWFDRFPRSRRPSYPRFKGEQEIPVAVIGGGITGAACALSLALAGIPAVVLDADAVGAGLTAGAGGVIREGFAGSFSEVAETYGLRRARAMWSGQRRAGLDFAAALKRHKIAADVQPCGLVAFSAADRDAVRRLRREDDARRTAGVESSWMTSALVGRETCLESGGGIRSSAFTLDPYRACLGLLRAAAVRGVEVFEHSAVLRLKAAKHHVDVITANGVVRAGQVIVTTGAPIPDLRALARHLRPKHTYAVWTQPLSAAVKREVGRRAAVLEPFAEPGRLVRWLKDDTVLVHGGQQPPVPSRGRDRALVQRTGQLMYELLLLYPAISGLQPESSWDAVDYDTVDGLPFVGTHRRFPRHFFAFGSARHGAGAAWLAARAAVRHVQGEPASADAAFGFDRIL